MPIHVRFTAWVEEPNPPNSSTPGMRRLGLPPSVDRIPEGPNLLSLDTEGRSLRGGGPFALNGRQDCAILQIAVSIISQNAIQRSAMTALTVRLNEFDAAILEDLVQNTGESKTALVIDGLRSLYNAMREEDRVTRLSADEFDAFLRQLEEGEKDPRVLLARERLINIKPVWED